MSIHNIRSQYNLWRNKKSTLYFPDTSSKLELYFSFKCTHIEGDILSCFFLFFFFSNFKIKSVIIMLNIAFSESQY